MGVHYRASISSAPATGRSNAATVGRRPGAYRCLRSRRYLRSDPHSALRHAAWSADGPQRTNDPYDRMDALNAADLRVRDRMNTMARHQRRKGWTVNPSLTQPATELIARPGRPGMWQGSSASKHYFDRGLTPILTPVEFGAGRCTGVHPGV